MDLEDMIFEDREWINNWRSGMYSSSSRDYDGWPMEMHGIVNRLEEYLDRLEKAETVWFTELDYCCDCGSQYDDYPRSDNPLDTRKEHRSPKGELIWTEYRGRWIKDD